MTLILKQKIEDVRDPREVCLAVVEHWREKIRC